MRHYVRPRLPGTAQHLIARFMGKEFRIAGQAERNEYLRRVALVAPKVDLTAPAYALMSSHIHWAALAANDPAWRFILPIHSPFARWLNKRESRSGYVFMERFQTVVVEGDHLAQLLAYVHNNPVRAGVIKDPADSSWSSHRAYIGDVPAPPWLDVELGLSLAGFDASPRGRLAFHEYVCSRAGLPRDPSLSGDELARDRAAVRAAMGPAVEGGAGVIANEESGIEIHARPRARIRPAAAVDAYELLHATSELTGLPPMTICSSSRRPRMVRARRLALFVWARIFERPQKELLAVMGKSSSAGSRLLGDDSAIAELMADANILAELCLRNAGLGHQILPG
jgi:hypothetical protein